MRADIVTYEMPIGPLTWDQVKPGDIVRKAGSRMWTTRMKLREDESIYGDLLRFWPGLPHADECKVWWVVGHLSLDFGGNQDTIRGKEIWHPPPPPACPCCHQPLPSNPEGD